MRGTRGTQVKNRAHRITVTCPRILAPRSAPERPACVTGVRDMRRTLTGHGATSQLCNSMLQLQLAHSRCVAAAAAADMID